MVMEKPLVSIVTPVYNASRFLSATIDSVLAQVYTNWELLLIDDKSKDDSLEIAYSYASRDERIKVLPQAVNSGVAVTRNIGIREARGEYIALLDSDDIWLSDKLERQVSLIQSHEADICYCSYDLVDEAGNPLNRKFVVPAHTDYRKMLTNCVFSCSTNLFKAELLKENPFDPSQYHEDFVLWMKLMSLDAKAVGDEKVLAHYRQVSGSRSNNKINASKERWKIYRNVLHMNLIETCFVFIRYAVRGCMKYYL